MCKEYKTHMMWQGGGCKIGDCDKIEYTQDACANKPAGGIRKCADYKMITAASSRRKGPRPGHNHAGQGSSSGTTA